MAGSADELANLLDLERLEVDLYRGAQARTERQRVFGGQVAAQAVVAATRSVESQFVLHSLHSYFLRPGDTTVPIVYDVERIRDGRSFVTRRVSARQHGRPIYYMTANFQIPEPGLEHQDRMPEVPAPEQGMPLVELARSRGPEAAGQWEREWAALDIRHVGITGQGLPEDP
jgi:acyl-CoA thioesterase-2